MVSRWKRFIGVFVFLAAASGVLNAQSGRTKPTPTPTPEDDVRIITEEVKLNVLAFDEDGKFVSDVRAEDLVVTDNDILHQPSSVRRKPANVLIMLDTGGELRAVKTLDQTKKTARALISELRSGDSVALLQYSDKPEILLEWTSDKQTALDAVGRAKFGKRSAFVDAITLATDFMMRSGIDNKHLVMITDGTDSWGRTSARFDAFRRLLGTDISVHVISYTSMEAADVEPRAKSVTKTPPPPAMPPEVAAQLPNGVRDRANAPKVGPTIITDRKFLKTMRQRKADLELAEEQLTKLTADTNGEMIVPTTLEEMVARTALVARMIDSSYVVTYTPKVPITEGSSERTISVTSKRDGLVVESRRKLVVPPSR